MSIGVLKSICVDFSDESLYQYITVFSEEIYSRTIEITPLNNGEEYIIPAEATARLEARKPDNKPILLDSKIDFTNNKIYIELTPKCLDTPGVTSCQIGLYGVDNRFIASSYFYIDVYRSALSGNGSVNHPGCNSNVVESSPEYQSFRVALLSVDEVQKRANAAILKAENDISNAIQNMDVEIDDAVNKISESAEEAIKNVKETNGSVSKNELERKENETQRQQNEQLRDAAEEDRKKDFEAMVTDFGNLGGIAVSNEEPESERVVAWIDPSDDEKTLFMTSDDITQELGNDPNKVLSQKAATANFHRFATYNLLNDLEIEKDKCLTTSDGVPQANGNGWAVTGYIPVEAGKQYVINYHIQDYNYGYDADGVATNIPLSLFTRLSDNEGTGYFKFTVPENCVSFRFSFKYSAENIMMYENENDESKPFVPFIAVSADNIAKEAVTTEKIKTGAVSFDKLDDNCQVGIKDRIATRGTENILFTDLLQQGNINYLTGAEMDSETVVRTDFIKLNDNINYVLSAFSMIARYFVIYYDENKGYLGYATKSSANNSYITKSIVNTADFVGARYIRIRFETNVGTSVMLETMYPVQLEAGTDIGHYVAANRAFKYVEEYDEQKETSKIFYNGDYDDFARLISSAVKEIYVPDNTYKGTLTFSKLIKETGNTGSISFYTTVDTGKTLVYRSAPLTNTSGVRTIEIPSYIGGEPAYIVIDWDKVPDGTDIKSKNYHPWILVDGVYDIENAPTVKGKLFADTNRIFFDDNYNETTTLISSAVLALYVGDSSYKGNLRFCVFRKLSNTTSTGIFRFYAYEGGAFKQIYETPIQYDLTGVKIIEMQNILGGEPAYIMVNWDKIPDGTSLSGKTGAEMILNDKVYEEAALSEIQMAMAEKSTERNLDAKGNLNIFADKFRGGEVETNLLKFHRNFNIPKKGLFFSTDVEYYKALDNGTTDEERIKGLIPYLYFNGKKIGTVILYDETTGEPFVYLADGTKKILS